MRIREAGLIMAIVGVLFPSQAMRAQPAAAPLPKTILAIGAHAGDMELTAGAVLIKQRKLGDRVVILQMTLGEGGNPRLSPAVYGAQETAGGSRRRFSDRRRNDLRAVPRRRDSE